MTRSADVASSTAEARTLRSEEAILAAVESGEVTIEKTSVVLDCPIVHLGHAT
jgi:hypothetical protein